MLVAFLSGAVRADDAPGADDQSWLESLMETSVDYTAMQRAGLPTAQIYDQVRIDRDRVAELIRARGYYGVVVNVLVDGRPVSLGESTAGSSLPEIGPNTAIALEPNLGPIYHVHTFHFTEVPTPGTSAATATDLDVTEVAGEPASAATFSLLETDRLDQMRAGGFAFAHVLKRNVSSDDADRTVDVNVTLTPGPLVRFGPATFIGLRQIHQADVAKLVPFDVGEQYNPARFFELRDSLEKLPLVLSVHLALASEPDASGNYSVTVTVREKPESTLHMTAVGWTGAGALGATALVLIMAQIFFAGRPVPERHADLLNALLLFLLTFSAVLAVRQLVILVT